MAVNGDDAHGVFDLPTGQRMNEFGKRFVVVMLST